MNHPSATRTVGAEAELVFTRVLDAPRHLVWAAWTDPQQIARWWGPEGFTTTTGGMDLRPGGVWRFVMHGPDGRDYQNRIVYTEVKTGELLAYRHEGEAEDEGVGFAVTVEFADQEDRTRLSMRMVFPSVAERERVVREYGAFEGGLQHIGRLAAHVGRGAEKLTIALPDERSIVLRRVIAAPRALVFAAFTQAEHVRQWFGCGTLAMPLCELDFRVGGRWRIVQTDPEGNEHPFCGEHLEIVPDERIVRTFIYDVEGIRDFPATETITFSERGGATVLDLHVQHLTREARDGHYESGMEYGANATMDRLEQLVDSWRARGAAAGGA